MPLALPLVVIFAALLSGCAQSSRTSAHSSSTPQAADADSPAEPSRVQVAAALAESSDESCSYQRAKGIAEVVNVEQGNVLLRFYPGDRLFSRARSESGFLGARVGDELRTLRSERISGNCEPITYQIIDGFELPVDEGGRLAQWMGRP